MLKKTIRYGSRALFLVTKVKPAWERDRSAVHLTGGSLSKRYTNHCVRSTTVSLLKSAGVEDGTLCLVTGHKKTESKGF